LASFLGDVIKTNGVEGCPYFEPYAGGAGAALTLLLKGIVGEVFVNDADERVSAFWRASLFDTDRFLEKVRTIRLSVDEWRRQHEICSNPKNHKKFEVGFAAFFMNRCNRSGVLTGAGPIGGFEQDGNWTLGVRFNREPLVKRIKVLAALKDKIHVSRLDAIDFLKRMLPRGDKRSRVFVYLDPPYVNKGQRLYLNAYEQKDHTALAGYLRRQSTLPWIMSYDDTPLVRRLYAELNLAPLPIQYSLQQKRSATELIIAPKTLTLPAQCSVHGKNTNLQALNDEHKSGAI
jgi:DNA adenine methylase